MADFAEIFDRLRSILLPYTQQLECTVDHPRELSLYTRFIQKNKKPLWFGGIQVKKNYVSYHLMPVYLAPELLDSISPELKKRMQGKSCFNFTRIDEALFAELAALTEAGLQFYEENGFLN